MKEALLAFLLMTLSTGRDSIGNKVTRPDTAVVRNADSAIAVELYKAEINLDRLSGK